MNIAFLVIQIVLRLLSNHFSLSFSAISLLSVHLYTSYHCAPASLLPSLCTANRPVAVLRVASLFTTPRLVVIRVSPQLGSAVICSICFRKFFLYFV